MKLDWNHFRIRNPNSREAFENLCYHLFCRKFQITEGLFRYKNQSGIETEPIKSGKEVIGFQSKFFDYSIDKNQIIESLKKAKGKNPKLNKVVLYINQEFSESSKKSKKDGICKATIEDEARNLKVAVEWIVPSHFEILMSQPLNSDLAQIYFGIGDEFGFIKSCCDPDKMTLLNSNEYIDIPFSDNKNQIRINIKRSLLASKDVVWMLVGHPGSGKSIYMHKLLQSFGGLDKTKIEDTRAVISKNKALPMLINLRDCRIDALENIIRNRQMDYQLRNNNFGIIYLFDGLDELDQEQADKVLTYVLRLSQASNTKKIIFSCRSGNKNRLKAKVYFSNIKEYRISELNIDSIKKYFCGKKSKTHENLLKRLERINPNLINKVTDILFVKLLWDTILNLNARSTVFDLIENKVKTLLNNPYHQKNIDALNVLDPKPDAVFELNKEIAYEFFKNYQFRFPEKDIQTLILEKFPRIDYQSVNILLNYLIDMFFDGNATDLGKQTYIYHHRRYQEYFFAKKLKDEYENDRQVLRGTRALSNQEFFDQLFLPFLRNEYEKENNLCRLLELNLIDVYLGRHRGWGADDPYYINSSEFIPSLAKQNNDLLEQLLEDETLQIKQKLLIKIAEVEDAFNRWEKDKGNYRYKDRLKSIWEGGIASLLTYIVIFWENKKFKVAKELLKNLDDVVALFKKREFLKDLQNNDQIRDPFWERFENWLFILIVIRKSKLDHIFTNLIRSNYSKVSDVKDYTADGSGKGKLIKSFFRVCLRQNKDVIGTFKKCDDFERNMFLDVLTTEKLLPLFIANRDLHAIVKEYVENKEVSNENYFVLFYKKFLGVPLAEQEKQLISDQLDKIQQDRPVDWHLYNSNFKYAVLSYAGSIHSFAELREESKTGTLHYYHELHLYAALFNGFVRMLEGQESIEELLRDYLFYVETHDDRFRLYLQVQTSFLWAYIFAHSKVGVDKLITVKERLLIGESKIIPFSLLYKLIYINPGLFIGLVNEHDIAKFENELKDWNDDFPSLIDRYLGLAIFYSGTNIKKAEEYISKAINDGVLRHGWRKDSIVSYHLVEALEILWRNNWVPKDIISTYAGEVFDLTLRVSDITDGKGTWQGPYNAIELVASYDIDLAEKFKKKLIERKGKYNISNWAITAVIKGKVKLGLPIESIERDMGEYSMQYDYENKPQADFFEQKFSVYLAIAQSDFYTAEERQQSFDKAYAQIEIMKEKNLNYYLRDDFEDEKQDFIKLCEKYAKSPNISVDEKKDDLKKSPIMTEDDFVSAISKSSSKRKLTGLYRKLGDYNNGIVLKRRGSWQKLVNKTYSVTKSVGLFTDLLQKNMYPHTDFMTSNSKYFHFGLAEALNNINTKEETLHYLHTESGHGGFLNIMRAYELNRDKDVCLKLFHHFLGFCKFLVY